MRRGSNLGADLDSGEGGDVTIRQRMEKFASAAIFGLPKSLKRLVAGKPVRLDGQILDLDLQVLLRLTELQGHALGAGAEPAQRRADIAAAMHTLPAAAVDPVHTKSVLVAQRLPGRLYTPQDLTPGSPLLVFFHGGGWVIGNLDTHDDPCRLLAVGAGVRVLAVEYRLAPEHPFPAAPQDAIDAYLWAREHASELDADPDAVAVGGDSAGGNLSAVVGLETARNGLRTPDFSLLFYPATSPSMQTESKRTFGEGLFLTEADMDWFSAHYCPVEQRDDRRYAPLHAEDLSGLPPTYVATAGFDPLRDDGEMFAQKLRDAGVPVIQRRYRELIHGYLNFAGISPRAAAAVSEAAGVLRAAFALHTAQRANSTTSPLGGTPAG